MEAPLKYLADHQEQWVQDLIEYVRIPSVSAQPQHRPDLLACADWILSRCQRAGLEAELHSTAGAPVIVARTPGAPKSKADRTNRPHFLVYGHYDVQPAEPFDLWKFPPFEPTIENGAIYARGVSDNKGQHWAHLKAVEAYLKTGTPLPCDITFVIEGEEEVGSQNLGPFLEQHKDAFPVDGVVVSDSGIPSLDHPALTYALRGIAALEITLTGPNRDLHSGIYGGSVENPAMALCSMLASLRDSNGHITIPGFYDDLVELTESERAELAKQPFDQQDYRKFMGVQELFGESGYTTIEQKSARPTLEINGLTSGYQGVGSKTIVPSKASAKLTMRLVPNLNPRRITRLVIDHLKSICPKSVTMELETGHCGAPYLVAPTSAAAKATIEAMREATGKDPILLREGGSIPIVTEFQKILGVDTWLLGMALPDDNAHSPNEKFSLDCFEYGLKLGIALWPKLSAAFPQTTPAASA